MDDLRLGRECMVCRSTSEKTGHHYGAITCYPCRAFFRRVPQRKNSPRCKVGGGCLVDHSIKKQCPGCRFQKCIRTGMQLSLVLNDDQRKERFKASLLRKQIKEDEHEENHQGSDSEPEAGSPFTHHQEVGMVDSPSDSGSHIATLSPTAEHKKGSSLSPISHSNHLMNQSYNQAVLPEYMRNREENHMGFQSQILETQIQKVFNKHANMNHQVGYPPYSQSSVLRFSSPSHLPRLPPIVSRHKEDNLPFSSPISSISRQLNPSAKHPSYQPSHSNIKFARPFSADTRSSLSSFLSRHVGHQKRKSGIESTVTSGALKINELNLCDKTHLNPKIPKIEDIEDPEPMSPSPEKYNKATNIIQHSPPISVSTDMRTTVFVNHPIPGSTRSERIESYSPIHEPLSQRVGHNDTKCSQNIARRDDELGVKHDNSFISPYSDFNERLNYGMESQVMAEYAPLSNVRSSVIKPSIIQRNGGEFTVPSFIITKVEVEPMDPNENSENETWLECDQSADSRMIMEYVHKKFGNIQKKSALKEVGNVSPFNEENRTQADEAILVAATDPAFTENRKRTSVIVQAGPAKIPRKEESTPTFSEIQPIPISTMENDSPIAIYQNKEEKQANKLPSLELDILYGDQEEAGKNSTCSLDELDIGAIRNLCSNYLFEEETNKINNVEARFFKSWGEIDLGEKIMVSYINFSKNSGCGLSSEYWLTANKQFRERYLNAICGLDLLDTIPAKTLFNLLKTKLSTVETLTYTHAFNQTTVDDQLRFILSKKDMEQWQAREDGISGLPLTSLIHHMPVPEESNINLMSELMSNSTPILGNQVVFILMVLLVICDSPEETVHKVRETCLTMLVRYLKAHSFNPKEELRQIFSCISRLPNILHIFQRNHLS